MTPQYRLCVESPTFGHKERSAVEPFILQCTQCQQCSVNCGTFHPFQQQYKHAGTGRKCFQKKHFLLRLKPNTGTATQVESQVTLNPHLQAVQTCCVHREYEC